MILNISVLPGNYSIYRFLTESDIPDWIYTSNFYSITRTEDEISVVANQVDRVIPDLICNRDWCILKIDGHLDFSLVGIVADLSTILKIRKIPIFVISTYDTDYFLIKQVDLNKGIRALEEKGHKISIK
jgi:hypothetical protein